MTYTPMLAQPLDKSWSIDKYLAEASAVDFIMFEPKLDGMRCIYQQKGKDHYLWSRSGQNITSRFPNVHFPDIEGTEMVLDGELIAFDDTGRASFNKIQHSHGRPGDPQASFIAFDLLCDPDTGDIRAQPLLWRKERLAQWADITEGLHILPYSFDGVAAWVAVQQQGLEGLIAKDVRAPYRAGRQADWIKIKKVHTISAVVTGFTEGEGSRAATFGSLQLALVDGDTLVEVGEVGSGFSQTDLDAVRHMKPPFVVDVSFQEWTGQALRFPVFKGVRSDIKSGECTIDQL